MQNWQKELTMTDTMCQCRSYIQKALNLCIYCDTCSVAASSTCPCISNTRKSHSSNHKSDHVLAYKKKFFIAHLSCETWIGNSEGQPQITFRGGQELQLPPRVQSLLLCLLSSPQRGLQMWKSLPHKDCCFQNLRPQQL